MTEVVVAGSNSRAVAAASANDIDAIKIAQSIPKRGLHKHGTQNFAGKNGIE